MASVIDHATGKVVTYFAMYHRYHAAYEEECDTIEEAVQYLVSGEDYGDLSSNGVRDSNGEIIISDAQMSTLYINHTPNGVWDGWPLRETASDLPELAQSVG